MKPRYAILSIVSAAVLFALSACQTALPGGGGSPPPPGSANCAAPAQLQTTISSPTTLQAGCYEPSGSVSVEAPLTLDPGVTILMPAGSSFDVGYYNANGTLHAVGTASAPIVFRIDAAGGTWENVGFYTALPANELTYVTVMNAGSAGDGDVYVGSGGSVTITHSTLEQGKAYGLYAESGAQLPGFSTNTITTNASGAAYVGAELMSSFDSASVYSGNTADRIEVDGGTVDNGAASSVTWPATDVPFYASSSIEVSSPVTVAPGFKMLMGLNTYVDVGYYKAAGTLHAVGNSSPTGRIVFQGEQTTAGYWDAVNFYSTSSQNALGYVTVSGGGNNDGDVYVADAATLSITNSTLENSQGYGLYTESKAVITGFAGNTLTGNTQGAAFIPAQLMSVMDSGSSYTGNSVDRVEVNGGTVDNGPTTTVTWPNGVPFYASSSIEVSSPVTVAPGFVMTMGSGTYVDVGYVNTSGSLHAVGNSSGGAIVFKGELANPGTWEGIYFYTGSSQNALAYATVSDGGEYDGDVYLGAGAHVAITHSQLNDSGADGICASSSATLYLDSPDTNTYQPASGYLAVDTGC